MNYNKDEYIANLKKKFGEFDDNFFVKENEAGEIETVVVVGKGVTNIEAICQCPTIKNLGLSRNKIESLLPLYGLTSIIELDVSHNNLKDLFGVASNTQIRSLNAGNNKLSEMYSFQVGKELYEKEFAGKPTEYVSEYFSKPKDITLLGQEAIQGFIRSHQN